MKLLILLATALGLPLFVMLAAFGLWQLHALDMAPLFLAMMLVDQLARPEWLLLVCLLIGGQLEARGLLAVQSDGWRLHQGSAPLSSRFDALPMSGPAAMLLAPSTGLLLLVAALTDGLSDGSEMALELHRAALLPLIAIALINLWSRPGWLWPIAKSPRAWLGALAMLGFYLGLLSLIWLVLIMLALAHLAWWRGRASASSNDDPLADYVDRLGRAAAQAGALLLLFGLSMALVQLANGALPDDAPTVLLAWLLATVVIVLWLGRRLPPLVWLAILLPWLPLATRGHWLDPAALGIVLLLLLSLAWFGPGKGGPGESGEGKT